MKRKVALYLLILITVVTGYLLLNPGKITGKFRTPIESGSGELRTPAPVPEPASLNQQVSDSDERTTATPEEEKRIEAMLAEYAELKKARDALRRQLGKLKARLWNLRLPADQARTVRERMQQGYAILKNPPMLGAFHDVEEVRRELAKVQGASNRLEEIEAILPGHPSHSGER